MDLNRIEKVYDEAARLSGDSQKQYLDEVCPEGTSLRTIITEMLGHSQQASDYFDQLQEHIFNPFDHTGNIIDHYHIDDLIGEGGMGKVYGASRSDGLFRQEVAIKVIKPGIFAGNVQVERERQILASLNHPNIAKIFNAGFTLNKEPYIVMEKVDGLPIDQYCKTHNPDFYKRMALFFQVCEAVRYAHQRLVIHCDLKPSNILVNNSGEVKLLDFGISTLLDLEDADKVHMLTPNHAAPEQFSTQDPNTATDVYQPGLLLCQLLTSRGSLVRIQYRPPYKAKS